MLEARYEDDSIRRFLVTGEKTGQVHDKVQQEVRRLLKEKGVRELRIIANIGRNDSCPCGSGRKFKKCCLRAAQAAVNDEQVGNSIELPTPEGGKVGDILLQTPGLTADDEVERLTRQQPQTPAPEGG